MKDFRLVQLKAISEMETPAAFSNIGEIKILIESALPVSQDSNLLENEIMRRIVACVNAFDGFDTDLIEDIYKKRRQSAGSRLHSLEKR